ncbi:MAG: hypothetical protein ACJ72W_11915, partial [Actinoallomurus sp.]
MCGEERVAFDRRKFLRGMAATAAGVAAVGATGGLATSAFAEEPASPVRGRHIPNAKIGLQLYSVRNAFMAQPEAVLSALAAAGYRKVEFAGLPGATDPAHAPAIRTMLDRYGLEAISSHHNYSEFTDENRLQQLIELATILGQKYI